MWSLREILPLVRETSNAWAMVGVEEPDPIRSTAVAGVVLTTWRDSAVGRLPQPTWLGTPRTALRNYAR